MGHEVASRSRPRIALLGHYHGGNLGDELTVSALVQNLRRRLPDADLVGFSNNPEDTRRRHGIRAFPVQPRAEQLMLRASRTHESAPARPEANPSSLRGRLKQVGWLHRLFLRLRSWRRSVRTVLAEPGFLWRSYHRLRGVDCVIVAGSHPFTDWWSGAWGHPYLMLRWAVLARVSRVPFVPTCVGAGPIEWPLGRLFLRTAMQLSEDASFRDESGARVAREELGVRAAPVLPDLVFGLDVDPPRATRTDAATTVVGLNPMRLGDPSYWPRGDAARYEALLGKLGEFGAWLLQQGHDVVLFSSETRADPLAIQEVRKRIGAQYDGPLEGRLRDASVDDAPGLLETLAACDVVVATRFHAIVLSHIIGRPTLALSYHPKTSDLMKQLDSDDWVDADQAELEELIEGFETLRREPEQRVRRVQRALAPMRDALEQQFDRVLETLDRTTRTRAPSAPSRWLSDGASSQPAVSIGIPVRNGAQDLPETLRGIRAQTFQDFEVLLEDDASSDETARVCQELASQDARIRYERSDVARGFQATVNRLIDRAQGRFFKLCSQDEPLRAEFLARCVTEFEAAPASVVLVYPRRELIRPDGRSGGVYDDRLDLRMPFPAVRSAQVVWRLRMSNPLHGLIPTTALLETRRFLPEAASDSTLLVELALRGEFLEMPEVLYSRRLRDGGTGAPATFEPVPPKRLHALRLIWTQVDSVGRAPLSPLQRLAAVTLLPPAHLAAQARHQFRRIVGPLRLRSRLGGALRRLERIL